LPSYYGQGGLPFLWLYSADGWPFLSLSGHTSYTRKREKRTI